MKENIFNVPNTITLARFAGTVYESIQYARTGELNHILKSGLYQAGDVLDGASARLLHQETEFGSVLDKTLDKAGQACFLGAAIYRREIDKSVLTTVGTINGINAAAATISLIRGTTDLGVVDDLGRHTQLAMNLGTEFNIVGNNIESNAQDDDTRELGKYIRYTAGALAVGSAVTAGAYSSIRYLRQAFGK